MRWYSKLAAAGLAALLQACATAPAVAPVPAVQAEVRAPITILISIDGFRADYLNRGVTPVLSRLAAEGASGTMRPSFPSKTFPNHWTIVTGLRPDRHGITANKIEDPDKPDKPFNMENDDPKWWNTAEPIWVAAEKANIRTATMFWPGSNVAFGGHRTGNWSEVEGGARPRDWQQFNMAISGEQRVNGALDWARRPAAIRPRFMTLYFDTIDSAGHDFGPDDPRTTAALGDVDRLIGMLVDGLAAMDQPANLVIVADHGMAGTSPERTILVGSFLPAGSYHVVETGPYASFAVIPGHEAELEKALLGRHDHFECWRKAEIPARFHYGTNPRIPPYFCLADIGWLLAEKPPKPTDDRGNHGYDNMAPEMAALFIAHGPAFIPAKLPAFDNVDVYPLLRDLLDLPPVDGLDGSDAVFMSTLHYDRGVAKR
ncbi:ectonucleotide pyrophosphatase/phosphodiesterase [Sphingomonas sp. LB-2]|uniref:alkaline phosphatase family protein n=1 Tax=Sphingomonas caeni TaxID=2984949 RepID=UPI00222EDD68|nr:ectonucleotide pyrophosphatase/phosphodiesterase [Sphingomonas caeni]MCW3848929.1 ectonucleotide pyrophosphatase/phosphodiesterase [Sphingomonas caeni]